MIQIICQHFRFLPNPHLILIIIYDLILLIRPFRLYNDFTDRASGTHIGEDRAAAAESAGFKLKIKMKRKNMEREKDRSVYCEMQKKDSPGTDSGIILEGERI